LAVVHWSEEDFAAIGQAIVDLFEDLGWEPIHDEAPSEGD